MATFAPYLLVLVFVIIVRTAPIESLETLETVGSVLAMGLSALNVAFMVHVFYESREIDNRGKTLAVLMLQFPFVIAVFFLAAGWRA
ncbi:MAG: hypothetical protein H7333_07780 [Bdellovibrionales bacterium]|nr:hypothetical protein [Oligoflexia bacterium]